MSDVGAAAPVPGLPGTGAGGNGGQASVRRPGTSAATDRPAQERPTQYRPAEDQAAQDQPAQDQPAVRAALVAMLEARSVALVGASPRPGSLGERMVSEVTKSPARPEVYLVNPRYKRIAGRPCHASLADLPAPVDLVLLAVPDAAVEEQLALAARRGDRSAVLFGSAHELPGQRPRPQPGPHPDPQPGQHPDLQPGPQLDPRPGQQPRQPLTLRARLAATARAAGMAVCGAGCMGFVNVTYGLRAVGYMEPDPLPRGPVALITHSGSVFSALLRTRRGLGFTVAVSSGQELVTTAAQYAEYALGLPETRVLALVLEAIREPDRLRVVLAGARQRGIPVVMLTAGRSAGGRALVSAHSGALATADGGWEALAAAYGVHRVGDLAEMADTLELFALRGSSPPRPGSHPTSSHPASPHPASPHPAGPHPDDPRPPNLIPASHTHPSNPTVRTGIATVHDSGLERAHVADVAEELGVPFAAISAETTARLAALLDPGLEPANPLDVWGTGARAPEQLTGSLAALADDPAVHAVALAVDLVHEFDGDDSYPLAVAETARRTSKPVVVLSNVPAAIDPDTAAGLRAGGIPVLEGTRSGLLALKHFLDHEVPDPGFPDPGFPDPGFPDHRFPDPGFPHHRFPSPGFPRHEAGPGPASLAAAADVVPNRARQERWTRLITAGEAHGTRLEELLRDYGIAAARTLAADSDAGAIAAAADIGYPVVLKTGEPGIAHKSDVGGVVLGIHGPDALQAAYQDLAERLGRRVLVCETIPAGPELSLGLARDPELGPLLVVGAGGVLVELLADRAVALPPVSARQAHQMLGTLRVARLLAGVRGQPAADLNAAAAAITSLSQLATELGDVLEALDINPLICGPDRAVAVDALAVPRQPAP
jgi:acetate---CoA ligase (ADP-forming)